MRDMVSRFGSLWKRKVGCSHNKKIIYSTSRVRGKGLDQWAVPRPPPQGALIQSLNLFIYLNILKETIIFGSTCLIFRKF